MNVRRVLCLALAAGAWLGLVGGSWAAPPLRVSEDRRMLERATGESFYYLGDTAWELFHRLDRDEASRYLRDRAAKGFTVIQAVALAEVDGLRVPNPYGHTPLVGLDPARPATVDGPANDYWDHVDHIVGEANRLGLVVAMLPTWGDKWNLKWGVGPVVFTPDNAEAYGEWLGRRYRDADLIWLLGGDRPIENDTHRAIIDRMARGIDRGDGGAHLMTFHPSGGYGSAQYFHDAEWLDFNMRQNGHEVLFEERFHQTRRDFDRTPIKPVIDGEPLYEDHPISFNAARHGHSTGADVRRPLYWNLFSGAFGHTYGHHSIWQMWAEGRHPINGPLMPWTEALDRPASSQMRHGIDLMRSRPMRPPVPDDGVLIPAGVPTSVPGAGRYRFVAVRNEPRSCAMVYAPLGRAFRVRGDAVDADRVRAWWFDPRSGTAEEIGVFPGGEERRYETPSLGETLDWVLVLDDAGAGFPRPGRSAAPAGASP